MDWESGFTQRAGALLRATANDLKRDDENAERDLGLPPGSFARHTAGTQGIDWDLIRRAAEVWPVNERDLLPIHDDCPRGLTIVRNEDSEATARVLSRGGEPYYEYRDTAMSRGSSYRPEWIRMLRVVGDNDPDNPTVQWNNGHLLYQFTYFVGPVNYYFRWNGVSRCLPMNTGDSVWGQPFAPHSFTARDNTEPAYILALTYGGSLVGDAQRELALLGRSAAHELRLPLADEKRAAASLIRSLMDARAVTADELAARSEMSAKRVAELMDGAENPTLVESAVLATSLGVSLADLLPPRNTSVDGVCVQFGADARRWNVPDDGPRSYRVTQLASNPLHPHTSAFALDVQASDIESASMLRTYQHQYLYVLGDEPVRLRCHLGRQRFDELLQPGDSAYVRPLVPVGFAALNDRSPRLLALRIAGAVTPEVRHAMNAMAAGGIDRYIAEDRLWYNKEGA